MAGKILIYGGTGGIGLATARLLYERGYRLHLVSRNADRLHEAAREWNATFTQGDVNDPALFQRAVEEAGTPLDGLLYAVGTINLRPIHRLSVEDFTRDFAVNALGAALAVQAALPALRQSEHTASVVLFSTVAVRQGFALHASISMAKGAVEGLTLALAAELAPKIRVNAIAPSLTRTPLAQGLISNEQMATAIAAMHPLQRLGTPEDIAALAAFLLSPESDWITGQVIGVDGGRSTLRVKA